MAQRLARHRRKDEAFSDLYGWAALFDSGLVGTRGGDLIVGYWTNPPDTSSRSPEFRESLSGQVNAGLARLHTGWAIWSDTAVLPAATYAPREASRFPDPVSRAIDEERRRFFTEPGRFMTVERPLILSFTPPSATSHKLAAALYRDEEPEQPTTLRASIAGMRRVLDQLEDQIGGPLGLRRMVSYVAPDSTGREHHYDELVNYLAYCAYGRHIPLAIPDSGAFLDSIIGGEDFTPGHTPLLGEEYIAVVTIDGFPAESLPGVLEGLGQLGMPFRFSQRFIIRDSHDAEKDIKTHRWMWKLAETPFLARAAGMTGLPVNQDAVAMREGCDLALSLAREGKVRFGYYTATAILRGPERVGLMDKARAAVRAIHQAGYQARIETENAPDALVGSWPGQVEANVRRPMLHTANLADMMPLSGIWTGSPTTPNPFYSKGAPALIQGYTDGDVPVHVNLCRSDNNNFAFFGPPGAGKTALLNTVAFQALRYEGMRVRAIDHKRGMLASCKAVKGAYYEIGAGMPAFAPFAHLESNEDLRRAEEWVRTVWPLHTDRAWETEHRDAVRQALHILQGQPRHRSVTNFNVAVQHPEVRDMMRYYQHGEGAGGEMFDGEGEDLPSTHWDAFDITAIISAGDNILLPALLCLMQRFEREEDSRPMLRVIDEGWAAIQHPAWMPHLHRDLKTKRSKNVGIGLATQNLADIAGSPLLPIFVENIPTIVYGANEAAQRHGTDKQPGPADLYASFGLSWEQREIIRTAQPKADYYLVQGEDHRLIRFGLGPLTLALAGATGEPEVRRIRALMQAHGDDWLTAHLQEKGLLDYARSLGL